jgi:hypothetical protein
MAFTCALMQPMEFAKGASACNRGESPVHPVADEFNKVSNCDLGLDGEQMVTNTWQGN